MHVKGSELRPVHYCGGHTPLLILITPDKYLNSTKFKNQSGEVVKGMLKLGKPATKNCMGGLGAPIPSHGFEANYLFFKSRKSFLKNVW